jgi:hypothetical protein
VAGYSSQATNFPAENLRDPQRSKPWRTTGDAAEESVVFDLGSARLVHSVILLDYDFATATDTAVAIQGHTSNSWGSPAFSEDMAFSADTWLNYDLSSGQTYRYWRLLFTKPSAATIRNIGRVYLGSYYTPTDPPDFDGFTRSAVDLSLKTRTPYGAVFGETRPQYRRLRLDFTRIPNAQKVQLAEIAAAAGTVTPFFVQIDDGAVNDEVGEPIYVVHRDVPEFDVAGYDGESKWNTRLDLEEVL